MDCTHTGSPGNQSASVDNGAPNTVGPRGSGWVHAGRVTPWAPGRVTPCAPGRVMPWALGGSRPAPLGGSRPAPLGGSRPAPLGRSRPPPLGGSRPPPLGGSRPAPLGGGRSCLHDLSHRGRVARRFCARVLTLKKNGSCSITQRLLVEEFYD